MSDPAHTTHDHDVARALIARVQSGDRDAFGELYELYFVPVYRYLYARTRDSDIATDLAQTVFMKVLRVIDRFRDKKISPLAYFFTVARNTLIDHWRKHNKDVRVNDQESVLARQITPEDNPEVQAQHREDVHAINVAMTVLTADQQDVIRLRFQEGLSNKEVAILLGKNETAIRQLQVRALKALRRIMVEHPDNI